MIGVYPVASDEFFNGDDIKSGATIHGVEAAKGLLLVRLSFMRFAANASGL